MPSLLVVVAHADDETLICGAAIRRRVQSGDAVSVLWVTTSPWSNQNLGALTGYYRQREGRAACGALGVYDVHVGPLTTLYTTSDVLDVINDHVAVYGVPDEMWGIHDGDDPNPPNNDHVAVGQAVRQWTATNNRPGRLYTMLHLIDYQVPAPNVEPLGTEQPFKGLALDEYSKSHPADRKAVSWGNVPDLITPARSYDERFELLNPPPNPPEVADPPAPRDPPYVTAGRTSPLLVGWRWVY